VKRTGIVLLLAFAQLLPAGEKTATGTVTYLAAGTVYTSLGRQTGVQDSSIVYVMTNGDTIAVLQVVAVSSKSSACRIVRSKRDIALGSFVVTSVTSEAPKTDTTHATASALAKVPSVQEGRLPGKSAAAVIGPFEIHGRVSAQAYLNRYDNPLYNTTQPGVVLNLRGKSTDVPLKFELYTNVRTLSFGNTGPFSKSAVNQSRVYRLSLEYDDGKNDAAVGRIIPAIAPSVGYIDGAMYSRRVGRVVVGTTFGFQPSFTLRGISTDYRKLAVFVGVEPSDSLNLSMSTVYARTYFRSLLDREVVSANVSLYTASGFQVYAYSEVDLRTAVGDRFRLSPSMTSLFTNISYRLTKFLTLGLGADATRPLYSFSVAKGIPDSLRETRLRSGVNSSITIYLPGGVTISNSYSPRTSESRFASVYSNYSSIGFANLFWTGISLHSNVNINANEYSSSNGYGVSLQRNIMELADINIRFQQNAYTLKTYEDKHLSRTIGTDLIMNLTRSLAVMVSYDRLKGYGITSNSIFGELSVRF
jgi:hypothetical protein